MKRVMLQSVRHELVGGGEDLSARAARVLWRTRPELVPFEPDLLMKFPVPGLSEAHVSQPQLFKVSGRTRSAHRRIQGRPSAWARMIATIPPSPAGGAAAGEEIHSRMS